MGRTSIGHKKKDSRIQVRLGPVLFKRWTDALEAAGIGVNGENAVIVALITEFCKLNEFGGGASLPVAVVRRASEVPMRQIEKKAAS